MFNSSFRLDTSNVRQSRVILKVDEKSPSSKDSFIALLYPSPFHKLWPEKSVLGEAELFKKSQRLGRFDSARISHVSCCCPFFLLSLLRSRWNWNLAFLRALIPRKALLGVRCWKIVSFPSPGDICVLKLIFTRHTFQNSAEVGSAVLGRYLILQYLPQ